MFVPLPKYDPIALCPKCDWADVGSLFCQGEKARCRIMLLSAANLRHGHMHRTCRRCNNEWLEAPRDYAPDREFPPCDICGVSFSSCAIADCGHVTCADCRLEGEPIEEGCPACYEPETEEEGVVPRTEG